MKIKNLFGMLFLASVLSLSLVSCGGAEAPAEEVAPATEEVVAPVEEAPVADTTMAVEAAPEAAPAQ
jgi:PBP1b-binding outer membrane lipoprotein LpoB